MTHKINFKVQVDRLPPSMVRDYNTAQGVTHPSDLTQQVIRDINMRYVTVENSSPYTPVGIAIANSFDKTPTPPLKFVLAPGEIRHLGINTIGEQMQYIHILNLRSGIHMGEPYPFRTDGNQFVLREGINEWFVQAFKRATYRASY